MIFDEDEYNSLRDEKYIKDVRYIRQHPFKYRFKKTAITALALLAGFSILGGAYCYYGSPSHAKQTRSLTSSGIAGAGSKRYLGIAKERHASNQIKNESANDNQSQSNTGQSNASK